MRISDWSSDVCSSDLLLLIEDAAQALMAGYHNQPLGSFGDFAAFSFHNTKNIGCGEGGALLIKKKNLLEKAWQLRDQGTNRMAFLRGEVAHYQWTSEGSSYGLDRRSNTYELHSLLRKSYAV